MVDLSKLEELARKAQALYVVTYDFHGVRHAGAPTTTEPLCTGEEFAALIERLRAAEERVAKASTAELYYIDGRTCLCDVRGNPRNDVMLANTGKRVAIVEVP